MAPDVIASKSLGGTRLELTFADGCRRDIDIATLVRPDGVFTQLFTPGFVASAKVNPETGTIEWASGADLSPEVLYHSGRLLERQEDRAA